MAAGSVFAKRYEILEELGKGGMGEVYRVQNEKLDDEAISAFQDIRRKKMPWIWNSQPIIAFNADTLTDILLAQAYKVKEDLDRAIEVYERLTDPNPENREGILIRAIYHHNLAELYEAKGRRTKAIASYEKFLTLSKNAGLWIEEIEDASKRLAELSPSSRIGGGGRG